MSRNIWKPPVQPEMHILEDVPHYEIRLAQNTHAQVYVDHEV
jgi:hypothetical protein